MPPPVISIQSVSKNFDTPDSRATLSVLENLEFEVPAGSVVSLLGPSGCGKTTILRLIAGTIKPDAGRVVFSRNQEPVPRAGVRLGYVFQDFRLLPWLTVMGNIKLGADLSGVGNGQRMVALIAEMGLGAFEDYFPRQLSEGMKQRVGLARAIAADPEVLLLDEPLGAVDDLTREILREDVLAVVERRMTVLHVTHSIDDAIVLSDEVLLLSPRPAQIVDRVRIDLDRPRKLRSIAKTEAYLDIKSKIVDTFRFKIGREKIVDTAQP